MRLYFNFNTNIPDTVKELSTVQVEAITFRHKGGETIDIRLWGEADYGVEDGVYDARWKGLEFQSDLINENDISITDDDEDIPEAVYDKLFEYLKESVPEEIEYYFEEPKYWNVPDEDFEPTCENLEITLEYGDESYTWKSDKL
jgi:hypothetical protein